MNIMVIKSFISSNALNKLQHNYLVGSLERFNNGKRAEEHDRVKHTITE